MTKRKTEKIVLVKLTGLAHKGFCIGRTGEGMVVFTKGVVPGDVAEVILMKKRKGVMQGKLKSIITPSPFRQNAFCEHFGVCGGCSWQELSYEEQLNQKNTSVKDAMLRIAKSTNTIFEEIAGASHTTHYRNKLEFTFSTHRWLNKDEISEDGESPDKRALGFHRPESFDKVVDIHQCYLQHTISNDIRNEVRTFCIKNDFSFYDIRTHEGFMRNLILRTNKKGEVMCIVAVGEDRAPDVLSLVKHLSNTFPSIISIYSVLNTKKNDSMFDLLYNHEWGVPFLEEKVNHVSFLIGPKSFFQTNSFQAERLYSLVDSYADLQHSETVYDLYCGVGSIGIYLSKKAKYVVGIEEIPEAVDDAVKNVAHNQLENMQLYTGDVKNIFNPALIAKHGRADVVVVDPPRAGLHADVVQHILNIEPDKIIYVSCNPATQARDVSLFMEKYDLVKLRPVDMFPHTNHIESVGLLVKRI